jgi:NAD(P)-dependent dehydrogenase (short-subunit alcohol dehydrogenase family)
VISAQPNKVALVTGGASGIGLGITRRLARDGAAVGIVDFDPVALEQTVRQFRSDGHGVHGVLANVGVTSDVELAIQEIEGALGPVDVLVNNAGGWVIKPYLMATDEDFHRQMATNVYGTHLFMSRVLPGMIERGHGAIINISSVAALHYTVPHAVYAASKAAVIALTRDVAFEVAPFGVRVNSIAPGLIAVDKVLAQLNGDDDHLDERTDFHPVGWGRPEDIANVVAFLASEEARFVIGTNLPVAGGSDLLVAMASAEVPALLAPARTSVAGSAG